jgi:hypothetical protein
LPTDVGLLADGRPPLLHPKARADQLKPDGRPRLAHLAATSALSLIATLGFAAPVSATGAWRRAAGLGQGRRQARRKAYQAWDASPELGLEFVGGTGDGPIDGEVVWSGASAGAVLIRRPSGAYRGAVRWQSRW